MLEIEKQEVKKKVLKPVLKNKKVGFIGAGNMARAIISGLRMNSEIEAKNIFVVSRTEEKSKNLEKSFGVQSVSYADDIFDKCDYIVLAMKPQDLPDFLSSYGKSFTEDHSLLSLCAGITLDTLRQEVPQSKEIARLMPSTTCEFGKGIMGIYSESKFLSESIEELFSSLGLILSVNNEAALDGIMISAASGVAFILEIMQIWSEWLADMDFEKDQSDTLVKASFAGVAELLKLSPKSFSQLQVEVTSKKGVTEAGLEAMRSADLVSVLNKGFEAALRRNEELQNLI